MNSMNTRCTDVNQFPAFGFLLEHFDVFKRFRRQVRVCASLKPMTNSVFRTENPDGTRTDSLTTAAHAEHQTDSWVSSDVKTSSRSNHSLMLFIMAVRLPLPPLICSNTAGGFKSTNAFSFDWGPHPLSPTSLRILPAILGFILQSDFRRPGSFCLKLTRKFREIDRVTGPRVNALNRLERIFR